MPKTIEDKFNPSKSTKLLNYNGYFADLYKLYENRKFPKILMLTGEKGLGKFTFIFHLINFFFTKGNKNQYDLENYEINVDNDFYKQILSNVNQNFIYLGKNFNKKVGVDEIRDIKNKFNTSSLNELPRFTILDDADILNPNSANALLKLIEEPSNLNYFILINNKRKKIIETLKSRSLEVKIFMNKEVKAKVLNTLSIKFKIELDSYPRFIEFTTPGTLIRVLDCLITENIKEDLNFMDVSEILLDKYKKDKNDIYIETIRFLLDINIIKKFQENKNKILKLSFFKKDITKLLFQYENFNLSKNSILESFKNIN